MTNTTEQPTEQASDTMQIEGAPSIPGLHFRHFRGESDYGAMVDVLNGSKQADGMEEVATLEDVTQLYTNLKNCDPYKDMVMVEQDGKMVGFNRLTWWAELDGTHIYGHWGFLLPEWRGKGIGRALFHHSEERLREIAKGHPQDAPKFIETGAYDDVTGLVSLIKSEGYEPVRHGYEMVRPNLENIPDALLPEGLETRPVNKDDEGQMRQIWAAEVEAFRDHWGMDETEDADFDRWESEDGASNFQPELWQVAWDGDEVVGMVRNYIDGPANEQYNRKRGYTEYISVRRPWRKRGVARALIARSFRLLKELGMAEAALGVDATNPNGALQLYESMGFKTVKSGTNYRKPLAQA